MEHNNATTAPGRLQAAAPDIDSEKWYTVVQVCRLFDIEERTLRNWRRQHKITCYKFGRRVRFCASDIQATLVRYRQMGFLPALTFTITCAISV